MKTPKVNIDMVDDESYIEANESVNIIDLPMTLLRKWNVSVVTLKMPPVNTTKNNLTPYLCHWVLV